MSKRFALFPVPLTPVDVIIGCATDSECPEYLSCINQACRDPCILSDPCAPNAFCKVIFHTPKCACPAGYLGDPQIECKLPRKNCFIDSIKNNWFYKNLEQLIIYRSRATNGCSQLVAAPISFQAKTHFLYVFHVAIWTPK